MPNTLLLTLLLLAVIGIGAFMVHEENESPLEKASEATGQMLDDAGDAARDVGDAIEDTAR